VAIINFQPCSSSNKKYRKFDDEDMDYPLLPQNEKLGERLLTRNAYQPTNIWDRMYFQDDTHSLKQRNGYNLYEDSPKVTNGSIANRMNSPPVVDYRDITFLHDEWPQEVHIYHAPTTTFKPSSNENSMFRNIKNIFKTETCEMCFSKYNRFNILNSDKKKIILPCCKKHMCCNCKEIHAKEGDKQGLEVIVEDRTPFDVIKCLKCPFCEELIPQKEEENDLLFKIESDSTKLHEQMNLMREAMKNGQMDLLTYMVEEAKDPKEYFFILMDYIARNDVELYSLLRDLEKYELLKMHETMKLMKNVEADGLLAFISTHRENVEHWTKLMKFISKHDSELFLLVNSLESFLDEN